MECKKSKLIALLTAGMLCMVGLAQAQTSGSVGVGTSTPNPSAGLDVDYANKGFLPPRMTSSQRDAITNPANGLIIFNTTTGCPNYYSNGSWYEWRGTVSYPYGFVSCSPSNPTQVVDVTNPTTGKTWMDRNLGASQVATSSTDENAFGDLYQWGRFADGHQCRTSSITTTLSGSDIPGHGDFISPDIFPLDWRNPQNANLWQVVSRVNNPCPSGYRIPTEAEWNEERLSWSSNNAAGAFASPLKLTMAAARNYLGDLTNLDYGEYWGSSTIPDESKLLLFTNSMSSVSNAPRSWALSVRCIKDNSPAGSIGSLDCSGATVTGTLTEGVEASGVSAEVGYTDGNGGPHEGQTVTSTGVTGLTAATPAGNFATGAGTLTYTITGTPASSGTATFALNIGGQACNLEVTVATGSIGSLDCTGATVTGTLTEGVTASGVSAEVGYTGGNGGPHVGQTVTSTGVTGLTAATPAGNFATGAGTLTYTITGTPASSGTAAFALNIGGQACNLEVTVAEGWNCGDPLTDTRDAQVYTTIQIGAQCWMQENLNIGTMINGSQGQMNNSVIEKYCYGNSESNCDIYGGLYQWNETMQYTTQEGAQGICPDGWHAPTDTEWTALESYVSSQSGFLCNADTNYIGKALAAQTNWQTCSFICAIGNDLNANNATGFSGLPGGYRYDYGGFNSGGYYGYWWTSTESHADYAWGRYLHSYDPEVNRYSNYEDFGFSVRCLRDN